MMVSARLLGPTVHRLSIGNEGREVAVDRGREEDTMKTTKISAPVVCDVDCGVEGGEGFVKFDGGVFSMNGEVVGDASTLDK